MQLSQFQCGRVREKGRHALGDGLYLQVTRHEEGRTCRSWIFRYMSPETRKERFMGLGALDRVPLAEARAAIGAARSLLRQGPDPIAERGRVAKRQAESAALEVARAMSFDDCASAYFASHNSAWSAKHRQQFTSSIAAYVSPVFGKVPVAAVDTGMVMKVLERNNFWNTKTETASRVRSRIEKVLDWAEARGFRPEGVNPASWRKLSMLLPSHRKLKPVEHFAAMPYLNVPAFMETLAGVETMSARALEFTILTAARAGEATGARWSEIDLPAKVWTVPVGRMKIRREHRVPLSEPACRLLERLQAASVNHFVFPGTAGSLSPDALFMLLRRMGKGDITTHGFRSSFRDWSGNETHHARETCEAALAHRSGDSVERSYRRGDALEKRRLLMCDWAEYLTKK